jgi:uncharacterized membrane protein YedE/YeeE
MDLSRVAMTVLLFIMSLAVGFLAQRSRMCFIAGIRDYFIIRDTELLFGLFSFITTIFFLSSLFYGLNLLKGGFPQYGEIDIQTVVKKVNISLYRLKYLDGFLEVKEGPDIAGMLASSFLYVTFFGGLFIGLISTFAGGCALRQHVLFAQGQMDSLFYLIGFYAAVVFYYLFLYRLFVRLY